MIIDMQTGEDVTQAYADEMLRYYEASKSRHSVRAQSAYEELAKFEREHSCCGRTPKGATK